MKDRRLRWSSEDFSRLLLWGLTAAFFLRVLAQALQYFAPRPFLPPFSAFQGSDLPYAVLLASQLLILAAMLYNCWKQHNGTLIPDPRIGRILVWLGAVYMAGSVLRIVVGLGVPSAPDWYRAWISAIFHLVLAGFVLTLALHHLKGSNVKGSNRR